MQDDDPDGGPPPESGPDFARRSIPLVAVEDPPSGPIAAAGHSEPWILLQDDDEQSYRDWQWVEQWRQQRLAPAWGPGIALAAFVAVLVAVALLALTSGLSDVTWLAVLVNVVIAAGMAPALWLSRGLPVLRFLAGGAAVGLIVGWIWMLLAFPG